MRARHSHPYGSVSRTVSPKTGLLLARNGDYFAAFSYAASRYQGWFVRTGQTLTKVIDSIYLSSEEPREIRNLFSHAERKYADMTETFELPDRHMLAVTFSQKRTATIIFDIREAYKNPDLGRTHIHTHEKERYTIEYRYKDEAPVFVSLRADSVEFAKVDAWKETHYELDEARHSEPSSRYLYHGLTVRTHRIGIGFGGTKAEAVAKAEEAFSSRIQPARRESIEKISIPSSISNDEITMAYYAAQHTIRDLTVADEKLTGLYAGLPWFFQFWGRDELISLPGLHPSLQTKVLERYVRDIPYVSSLASSDALGWLFFRTYEHARKEHLFQLPLFFLEPYAQNGVSLTWMDSIPERNGRRIETLALALSMYRNAYRTTKDTFYKEREEELRRYVRNALWNGLVLEDGQADPTIRPNLFIAAYVYPDLLTKEEWLRCFETALSALWLPWGGIATVDKKDRRFQAKHSGELPISYHNGDSWFFLNNMAALVMHRLDANRFRKEIDTIIAASTQEILWNGVIGRPSELSSAESLRSEGCWVQTWSAALYIELVREISGTGTL